MLGAICLTSSSSLTKLLALWSLEEGHVYWLDWGGGPLRSGGTTTFEPHDLSCYPHSGRVCADDEESQLQGWNRSEQRPILRSHGQLLAHAEVAGSLWCQKLLSWDVAAYDKLISDFEFMAKLAKEGKILQGMFVGRKLEGPKHEMWRKHSDQARHFPKSSLRHFAHTLKPWRAYERYIVWSWKDWGIRFHSSQSGSFAECFRVCDF